jgi:hypothetical protein
MHADVHADALDVASANGGTHRVDFQGRSGVLGLHHPTCAAAAAASPQEVLQLQRHRRVGGPRCVCLRLCGKGLRNAENVYWVLSGAMLHKLLSAPGAS